MALSDLHGPIEIFRFQEIKSDDTAPLRVDVCVIPELVTLVGQDAGVEVMQLHLFERPVSDSFGAGLLLLFR